MLESAEDVWKQVNLGVLRGEMQFIVEPPVKEPTYIYESRQELATSNKSHGGQDSAAANANIKNDRKEQLDQELTLQKSEEEKWTELSRKLEKKTKQAADHVVRLTTSLKVFRDELAKRSDRVTEVQEQLVDKQERAEAQMEKLQKDQIAQKEHAARATETAERAARGLKEMTKQKDRIEQRLKAAYRSLKPLEEKVQDLEVNLYGNNSLSGNQREYLKAEIQVERGHRDRVRTQIGQLETELEELVKECTSLTAKHALFQDEHKRRTLRAQSMETKIQEQQGFFKAQLEKFREQVDGVRNDRDAWEVKTLNMAEALDAKRIESQKLDVKLMLFKEQLTTVQAAVKRLDAMKLASMESSHRSVKSNRDEPDSEEDDDSDSDDEEEVVVKDPQFEQYVWQPPNAAVTSTATTVAKPVPKTVSPAPVVVKTTPKTIPAVIKPITPLPIVSPIKMSMPVVRVNHVAVKLDKPAVKQTTYQQVSVVKPTTAYSLPNEPSLAATLGELQRDLQHQKRFQQEHAIKMEKQYAQLASKVEGMNTGNDDAPAAKNVSNYDDMDSQLSALKLQIQKDAMRDAHDMRQLLQQMNHQCVHLATKLDGLTQEVKHRDAQNAQLEEKLKDKEAQYYEQMEFLRGEMQRQLERQQQVFADKISQAMIQMERVVTAHGTVSGNNNNMQDSMASLESLPPIAAQNEMTTTAYSMTSGIKVFGGPLFQK
ncbi:expressed unknown protein [Seminavis robusta]|uniref:Uncharacterized protein n=1 Tax=Seminavis robusta TaxID=568900 RepID=A0A9N8H613_9STRA|nr:expressed unknown protein [Seminavis robusta]|eukprot:Sro87_g046090.1 n/a (712) ;mRNA; f:66848-68983